MSQNCHPSVLLQAAVLPSELGTGHQSRETGVKVALWSLSSFPSGGCLHLGERGRERSSTYPYVALSISVLVLKAQPQFMAWCPDGWIGYRGKCYYFSEAENNWNNSQRHCFELGASLAVIDSDQDLAFMMRYKGISEHWIGLWKEQARQTWKWVNGSDFNSSFPMGGGGDCAYLNDKGVSSSRCITGRNWVCSKPDAYTSQKNATQCQELKSFTMGY
uniref:C-type lectin domain-containing protein n=1 Tax=Gopherus evgoodei TaxID=1825980 RepID=A0A8C4VXW1_9SAUR